MNTELTLKIVRTVQIGNLVVVCLAGITVVVCLVNNSYALAAVNLLLVVTNIVLYQVNNSTIQKYQRRMDRRLHS